MVTRKDLAKYSREDIHDILRDIVYYGKIGAQVMQQRGKLEHYNDVQLEILKMLCLENSDRLMLIIRGYAKDGQAKL